MVSSLIPPLCLLLRTKVWGVVPRAARSIFDTIANDTRKIEYSIKASYLEIYKEKVRDLLNPKNKDLRIREDKRRGVWVEGERRDGRAGGQGGKAMVSATTHLRHQR